MQTAKLSVLGNKAEQSAMVDGKLIEASSNSTAGRPKAALLFWFFCGFLMWCEAIYCSSC